MESSQDVGNWDLLLNDLTRKTGLGFSESRTPGAHKAILELMRSIGCETLSELQQQLDQRPLLMEQLVAELTVGETYFFREPAQYQLIEHELLPELRAGTGNPFRPRVWSAGCSSGEEAYSLGILYQEMNVPRSCPILASDLSQVALQKAQRGIYRDWSFRGSGASRALQYTTARDNAHQIHPEIRERVLFRSLNLAQDPYPSVLNGTTGLDLILCRNVLIYFDQELIAQVVRRLFECLNPGGWLLTAATDPPLDEFAEFEVQTYHAGIYYQRPKLPAVSMVHPGGDLGNSPPRMEESANGKPKEFGWFDDPALSADDNLAESVFLEEESPGFGFNTEKIEQQLQNGNYAFVIAQTHHQDSLLGRELYVSALANFDPAQAEQVCAEAVGQYPCSVKLRYRHALLLWELNRPVESLRGMRQVLFLDCRCLMGHYSLGTMLQQSGDFAGAIRAFRNVSELAQQHSPEEIVPLTQDLRMDSLLQSARQALEKLTGTHSTSGPKDFASRECKS